MSCSKFTNDRAGTWTQGSRLQWQVLSQNTTGLSVPLCYPCSLFYVDSRFCSWSSLRPLLLLSPTSSTFFFPSDPRGGGRVRRHSTSSTHVPDCFRLCFCSAPFIPAHITLQSQATYLEEFDCFPLLPFSHPQPPIAFAETTARIPDGLLIKTCLHISCISIVFLS